MAYNSKLVMLLFLVSGLLFGAGDKAMAVCVGGAPAIDVTVAPAVANVAMGTSVTYTVTVQNNDTDDGAFPICVARSFNLNVTAIDPDLSVTSVPAFATNPLAVLPLGMTNSTTFEITSAAIGLGLGGYNFTITASGGGDSDSDTATYNINSIDVEICGLTDHDSNPATPSISVDDDGDGLTDCWDEDCLSAPECCGNAIWENTPIGLNEACDKAGDIGCVNPLFPSCTSDCTACLATPTSCPYGWGNCDGDATTGVNGCETDLLNDSSHCGSCENPCRAGYCENGKCPTPPQGGLVPCSRLADNSLTPWIELQPCELCHIVILLQEIINFLMKLVSLVTVLAIIVAGLIHIKTSGDSSLILTAKRSLDKVLLGFVLVFIAWVIVNVTVNVLGFDDPLGDGSWAYLHCDFAHFEYCGDGIVQDPNSLGEAEECERGETQADFTARKIALAVANCAANPTQCCVDGNLVCPDGCFSDAGVPTDNDCDILIAAFAEEVTRCNSRCKIACKDDPLEDKIGSGCFISGTCQKGRYSCDLEGGGVSCMDIYGDPQFIASPWYLGGTLYDYCCEADHSNFADGFIGPSNTTPFTIERATSFPFQCEDVCDTVGKVCVGVGLTTPAVNACIYVIHDIGNSCDLPANQASTNCMATFDRRNPCDCTTGGDCFGVRETACYCAF